MGILVTGGSGLIGTYLKEILPEATYVSSKDFNLVKQEEVSLMFKKIKPTTVIHLAALVGGIHHNIQEPVRYFEENILMNTFVLRESFKNNVKHFTGILSSCIYPNDINEFPIKEDKLLIGAPHEDLFSYSYAKRCMAIQIDMYNKKHETKYNYLIPCNLYGEFDKFDPIEGHFVGALIEKLINAKKNLEKTITLFGDGKPFRQFMHAKDVANIIKMMIMNNKYHNMNIATNENYTIDAIAKIALRACDAEDISIIYDKNKPNGQMRKDIEISKLNKYFPKFLPIKLEKGIKEIYQKRISEND
jgi:GDP-L-fucose synthase|tara:strand:- start:283 stop:1191 length:909 start_codon:yes stop_codon:yes gene_type:complete